MSALIVFGSASGERGATPATEALRVVDDPEAVVKKLADARNGLASFELDGRARKSVWINRRLVRMIRTVSNG
jgi:hypothetical protein